MRKNWVRLSLIFALFGITAFFLRPAGDAAYRMGKISRQISGSMTPRSGQCSHILGNRLAVIRGASLRELSLRRSLREELSRRGGNRGLRRLIVRYAWAVVIEYQLPVTVRNHYRAISSAREFSFLYNAAVFGRAPPRHFC